MRPVTGASRLIAAASVAMVLAAAGVAIRVQNAAAGDQTWTPSTLYGGSVHPLVTSPRDGSLVLSGTGGAGVFRSTDGGQSWTRSSVGLPPDTGVMALAFAPTAPDTVYAGTYSSGLWRSTDAGLTWSPVATGTGDATVSVITVDPTNPSRIFIGDGGQTWRTTDGGATWTQLHWPDTKVDNVGADAVAVAPGNPDDVYIAGSPFIRSTDGGSTWQAMSQLSGPTSVLVDPHDASTLLVGTNDGIYRSDDAGTTWNQVEPIPLTGDDVTTLYRNPSNASQIWAGGRGFGIIRSDDGGTTWQPDDAGLTSYSKQYVGAVAVSSAGVLASVAYFGVQRRLIGGTTWGASATGITGSQINALAVAPSDPSVLYAAAQRQGVFRSTDSGVSWTYQALAGTNVLALAVSPDNSSIVWAATLAGVQRSSDGGQTWTIQLADDANADAPDAIAVAPSAPSTVYAAYFGGGVYRSVDGGSTWTEGAFPDSADGQSILVDPTDASSVWVGTRFQGVAHSADGGATWTYATAQPSGWDAVSLARDPREPNRLFAAVVDAGLYMSTDSGATWTLASGVTPSASTVIADPSMPGRIYLGSDDATKPGVLVSTDDGSTWQDLSATLSTTRTARSLAVQPDGTLFLGTTAYGRDSGGGIYAYSPATPAPSPSSSASSTSTPTSSPTLAPSSSPSVSGSSSASFAPTSAAAVTSTSSTATSGAATATAADTQAPPPMVTITSAPAPTTLATSIRLAFRGAVTYDIRYRRATWNGGFGAYVSPATWQRTAATSVRLGVARGATYCLSVRGRNSAGVTGAWSAARCSIIPLDDRSLVRSGNWSRGTGQHYYGHTITTTRSRHVTLTRSHIRTRQLALVATRCARCGWIAVYWNGHLLKRINLHAATTHNRSVIDIANFGATRRGTLVILTLGTSTTQIDGLAIGS